MVGLEILFVIGISLLLAGAWLRILAIMLSGVRYYLNGEVALMPVIFLAIVTIICLILVVSSVITIGAFCGVL